MKTWLICAAAATVAVTTPAWSQSTLDTQMLNLYGGSYSSDCSSSAAPHLRVVADALVVEQGTKRITGRNVQAMHSYFGQSPPPDYQVALLSDVPGGLSLMFIVYRDKSGQYIALDGDPKVQATLGKTLLEPKFRRCGDAIKQATSGPPAATKSEPLVGPVELLTNARFKSAYYAALGSRIKQDWLAKLDGPALALKRITVGGTEYLLVSVCKDHDCADNNAVLLYSGGKGVIFGKILEQRRAIMIGAPSPEVAAQLDRLSTAQWGQRP